MTASTKPVDASATKRAGGAARIIGIILIVAGAIMLVSGGVAWGAVSSQLKVQQMVVPDDAPSNAGKAVAGPFTAWSMQEIINIHAEHSTEGETYATLGDKVNEAKAEFGDDSEEAAKLQALRNTAQSAAFLRASLFTSILAFGVSALVMGLGVTTAITGAGFVVSGKKD
ncbi:hypothetical protein [Scrofimicrobium sp. R131]|uniref:Aromatic ring-opening dioxygenase LigA n=1 Tax=Scrofimicrobium appendicitidis TaxID=3079930 RepID=A0AAU7V824_9ACTO